MQKERIIFIYPKLFTFIKTEVNLLSDNYELIYKDQNWTNKFLLPFNLIIQFFFLLFNIRKVNTILISFAGYWSFFPSLFAYIFRKDVAIIVHGTDCVSFPDINYGSLRFYFMRYFIKKSYQWASIIFPVSESLVYTENTYFSNQSLKFGYTHHLKAINTPYKVIPNGLIIKNWQEKNINKIKKTFITVMTEGQLLRKGADLIFNIAKRFPDCKFYFAGIDDTSIKEESMPANIFFLGSLTPKELELWYNKTQFYLQLSNFEGFGVAICEAMLCKCVPIVSRVNFLPNIVGDTGFILEKRDGSLLEQIINQALDADLVKLMESARQRIIDNFSAEKRKKILLQELKNIKSQ